MTNKIPTLADLDKAVHDAKNAVTKLEKKRGDLELKHDQIAVERKGLAFAAMSGGDDSAKSRIAELRKDSISLGSDLDTVDAALVTAKAKLAEAQDRRNRAGDIERAHKIKAHAAILQRAGQDTDDAARALAKAFGSMEAALQVLRGLGISHPDRDLARVNLVRALTSALQGLPLRLEVIAPGDRHSFESITSGWAKTAERSASVLEAGPSNKEAA